MIPAFRVAWQNEDIQKLVWWLNDREIMQYSEQRHQRHTEQTQRAYIEQACPYWAIFYENALIGTIGATVDWRNKSANLGIMIGEMQARGLKLGVEAWCAGMEHMAAAGMRKIEAGMMAVNIPMIKTCYACGMVEEGRMRGHFLWNEQPMDLVLMGAIL